MSMAAAAATNDDRLLPVQRMWIVDACSRRRGALPTENFDQTFHFNKRLIAVTFYQSHRHKITHIGKVLGNRFDA